MTEDASTEDFSTEDASTEDASTEDFRSSVAPIEQWSLARQIGWQVQVQRVRQELNQAKLAARTGMSQQALSRLERGQTQPTTRLIERVFAALDLQVRFDIEPLGADLDDEIERYCDLSEEELIDEVEVFGRRLDQLADVPFVLTGRLAALVQGAPVAVRRLDVIVARAALEGFATWLDRAGALRWRESWQDYGFDPVDPRFAGPLRWMIGGAHEVRLEIVDALPNALTVQVGDRSLLVTPLTELLTDFPDVARILDRARRRRG